MAYRVLAARDPVAGAIVIADFVCGSDMDCIRMKVGLLGFETTNIGDDLQAIATSLNLPFVDRLIDREKLADARFDEPHFLIMQSWFTRQWFRPPSASIDPYYFAFCVGRASMSRGLWPRHLRARQPIGARDHETMRRLTAMGVESFWSGCLTLRIGSFLESVPAEAREGVYFVDLHPEAERLVPEALRERAIRMSNEVPPALMADPLARMARAAALNDRLRRAEVVVTRRLHTALPCVGLTVNAAAGGAAATVIVAVAVPVCPVEPVAVSVTV